MSKRCYTDRGTYQPPVASRELTSANDTATSFLGGTQKSWMLKPGQQAPIVSAILRGQSSRRSINDASWANEFADPPLSNTISSGVVQEQRPGQQEQHPANPAGVLPSPAPSEKGSAGVPITPHLPHSLNGAASAKQQGTVSSSQVNLIQRSLQSDTSQLDRSRVGRPLSGVSRPTAYTICQTTGQTMRKRLHDESPKRKGNRPTKLAIKPPVAPRSSQTWPREADVSGVHHLPSPSLHNQHPAAPALSNGKPRVNLDSYVASLRAEPSMSRNIRMQMTHPNSQAIPPSGRANTLHLKAMQPIALAPLAQSMEQRQQLPVTSCPSHSLSPPIQQDAFSQNSRSIAFTGAGGSSDPRPIRPRLNLSQSYPYDDSPDDLSQRLSRLIAPFNQSKTPSEYYRLAILMDAASNDDYLYLVWHQLYSSGMQSIGVPDLPAAFNIYSSFLVEGDGIRPGLLHVFQFFPAPFRRSDNLPTQYAYDRSVSFIAGMAQGLTKNLVTLIRQCQERGSPPYARELVEITTLWSPTLQLLVYNHVYRQVWPNSSESIKLHALEVFRLSQAEFYNQPRTQSSESSTQALARYHAYYMRGVQLSNAPEMAAQLASRLPQSPFESHQPSFGTIQTTNHPRAYATYGTNSSQSTTALPSTLSSIGRNPQNQPQDGFALSHTPHVSLQGHLASVSSSQNFAVAATSLRKPFLVPIQNSSSLAAQVTSKDHGADPGSSGSTHTLNNQVQYHSTLNHDANPHIQPFPAGSFCVMTSQRHPQRTVNGPRIRQIRPSIRPRLGHEAHRKPSGPPSISHPLNGSLRHVRASASPHPHRTHDRLMPAPHHRRNVPAIPTPTRSAAHQIYLCSPILKPAGGDDSWDGDPYYPFFTHFAMPPISLAQNSPITSLGFAVDENDFARISQRRDERGLIDLDKPRSVTVTSLMYRLRSIKCPTSPPKDESAWVTSPTSWAEHAYYRFNGHTLEERRKLNFGKDMSIDVTDYVVQGLNKLEVFLIRTDKDVISSKFALAVEIVSGVRQSMIVTECTSERLKKPSESLEKLKKALSISSDEDDDVAIISHSLEISLVDPFHGSRIIGYPARSITCKHWNCFDLETFLTTRKKSRSGGPRYDDWFCPICSADARPHCLFIDGFIASVRDMLDRDDPQGVKDVRAIVFSADGTWQPKIEDRTGQADESSDDENSRPILTRPMVSQAKRVVEVIDLDSD